MAKFDQYLPRLLNFEGGFVNDPSDPDGPVNKGIRLSKFKVYARALLGIEATLENLRALTDEQAGQIYKSADWDRLKCDEINDQLLAEILCDFYVCAGPNAVRLLQTVLNENGVIPSLAVDGVLGAGTWNALMQAEPIALYRKYKLGRRAYYRELVSKRPQLAKYLKGWLQRTDSFPDR